MEFLTATILSGAIYDIFKNSLVITKDALASRLKKWLIDDATLEELTHKMQELNLNGEMSEKAIEKKINSDNDLTTLLKNISAHNVITQNHSGTGDNVAGDKIINQRKE